MPVQSKKSTEIDEEKELCWRHGFLSWKLLPHQDQMYDAVWNFIENNDASWLTYCFNCSRRFGKTSVLLIVATEFATRNPGSIINYAMPTQKEARSVIRHFFRQLFVDCPEDIKPQYMSHGSYWAFPNGSEIHIRGVNSGHGEALRGHTSHLAFVDEAGQVDELTELVKDILRPTMLTTGGKLVIASTPPPTPGHYYKNMYDECKLHGNLSEYTIYDNTTIPKSVIEQYMEEAGGADSHTWKREYLIQFEVDEDRVIIPEFDYGKHVEEYERGTHFQYFHKYLGMDLGVINDYTAVVYGYYDFPNGILVIEDEYTSMGSNQTTSTLYSAMFAKEKELGYENMRSRIVDNNNPQLINDMRAQYGYPLLAVQKINLIGMVNQLRMWFAQDRIRIHPRCEYLIGSLQTGWWDITDEKDKSSRKTKKFGRHDKFKHFDHLAALMYMVRGIDEFTNPVPLGAITDKNVQWVNVHHPKHNQNGSLENLAKAFGKTTNR